MPMAPLPAVALTPVAYFPERYFLENLSVRTDGSVLVTTVQKKELWYVPGPEPCADVPPVLMHTFEHLILGIAEAEPDVFIVSLSDLYTTHESHLARVDLNGWTPGKPVTPEIIFSFDDRARCPAHLADSAPAQDGIGRCQLLYFTAVIQWSVVGHLPSSGA